MSGCDNRGLFGFGGWEWIIIIVLLVILFCPDIFSPNCKFDKCC